MAQKKQLPAVMLLHVAVEKCLLRCCLTMAATFFLLWVWKGNCGKDCMLIFYVEY
jgi:hypothetical protein